MAYIDQEFLENYLKRSLSAREAALFEAFEENARKAVEAYTGRTFAVSDPLVASTKDYSGDGTPLLFIDDATEITKVEYLNTDGTVNGTELDATAYVALPLNGTPKTYLERRSGRWLRGVRNIRVTAKFAYAATLPKGVQLATAMVIADVLSTGKNLRSESIEGYSRTWDLSVQNTEARELLDPYRKVQVEG